ncbi:MAG: hypothetical protein K2G90_06315 [Muribaculaceae bacterium]|nr:hypothetical protein [Muribaculaceae bacterium]MDE6008806.1 hypothetical protein [Muribaculaceae bacterium]
MTYNDSKFGEVIESGKILLVKNVMSASVLDPRRRLDYWKEATGVSNPVCAHEICNRPATHGGIAVRAFSRDRQKLVYPACETCVRRTEMLYVSGPFVELND